MARPLALLPDQLRRKLPGLNAGRAAIVLVGLAAYPLLPVAPLPQIDFPTLTVTGQGSALKLDNQSDFQRSIETHDTSSLVLDGCSFVTNLTGSGNLTMSLSTPFIQRPIATTLFTALRSID